MNNSVRILRLKDVCDRLGVSRSTIYNWLDRDSKYYKADFPRPMRVSIAIIGFLENEIDDFVSSAAARNRV